MARCSAVVSSHEHRINYSSKRTTRSIAGATRTCSPAIRAELIRTEGVHAKVFSIEASVDSVLVSLDKDATESLPLRSALVSIFKEIEGTGKFSQNHSGDEHKSSH